MVSATQVWRFSTDPHSEQHTENNSTSQSLGATKADEASCLRRDLDDTDRDDCHAAAATSTFIPVPFLCVLAISPDATAESPS